jgi:hypothetical protein
MEMFLACWLSIGLGFYLGLWMNNPLGWMKASAASLLRGLLLGIPFWPVGIVIKIVQIMTDEPKPQSKGDKNGRVQRKTV